MNREKQILLGFLGLLCGGFVAILGAKLFIPRPPAGAGPDIDAPSRVAEPQLVVEPPALDAPDDRPLPAATPDDPPPAFDRYAGRSAFATRDDEVTRAAFVDDPPGGDQTEPPSADSPDVPPADVAAVTRVSTTPTNPLADVDMAVAPEPHAKPDAVRDSHVTAPGDSWWAIAERAYGDGRYYKALYAWNRQVDPGVSLVPGTRLEIPPVGRLEGAWPRLVPAPAAVGDQRGAD